MKKQTNLLNIHNRTTKRPKLLNIHNTHNAGSPKRLLYELPFFLGWYYYALCALVVNVTAYNHLKGISRRNRHRHNTLICFHCFLPIEKQCILLQSRKLFCDRVFISQRVYKHIQHVGVNWFSDKTERDWLMSSIDTFWLANALGEHRTIAPSVECLKNLNLDDVIGFSGGKVYYCNIRCIENFNVFASVNVIMQVYTFFTKTVEPVSFVFILFTIKFTLITD